MNETVSLFDRCAVPDSSHKMFGLNLFPLPQKHTSYMSQCKTCNTAEVNMANIPREMHLSARPGVISICLFNLLNLLVSSTGRA